MVVHRGWKYIGGGASYAAFLVGNEVIKVPWPYFREKGREADERADFDIPQDPDIRATWAEHGRRQAMLSKYYGEYGVPTWADEYGLIHQEYVEGRWPNRSEVERFDEELQKRRMSHKGIDAYNFKMTPVGPRLFDYCMESLHPHPDDLEFSRFRRRNR